jgi:hypothetical protein
VPAAVRTSRTIALEVANRASSTPATSTACSAGVPAMRGNGRMASARAPGLVDSNDEIGSVATVDTITKAATRYRSATVAWPSAEPRGSRRRTTQPAKVAPVIAARSAAVPVEADSVIASARGTRKATTTPGISFIQSK